MGKNCASCKFYSALPESQCRVRAPKVFLFQEIERGVVATKMNSFYPQTRPESWCGEHQAEEKTEGQIAL